MSDESLTSWLQLDLNSWVDYLWTLRTTLSQYPKSTALCTLLATGWFLKRMLSSKLEESLKKIQEAGVYRYKRSVPLGVADEMLVKTQQYADFGRSTACMLVTGPLTPQLVREGLILLQQRHPQLRLGIHSTTQRGSSRYYFHEYQEPQDKIVFQVRKRKGDSYWMEVMEELSNSYRPCIDVHDRLLWEVVFLENGDSNTSDTHDTKHEILITASHVIMDGTSRVIFHTDLLKCIAMAQHAQEKNLPRPTIEHLPMHPSIEECISGHPLYFKARTWNQILTPDIIRIPLKLLWEASGSRLPVHQAVTSAERRDRFVYRKRASAGFIRACKRNHVSVHSGIVGLFGLAMQKALDLPASSSLYTSTPVRLRPYSEKHDLSAVLGNTVSSFEISLPLKTCSSEKDEKERSALSSGVTKEQQQRVWDYAQVFQNFMHESPEHKLPNSAFHNMHDSPGINSIALNTKVMSMLIEDNFGRFGNLHLSNLGNCSRYPQQYGEHKQFKLLEWHALTSQRTVGYDVSIFTATFHGEMFFTVQYIEPLLTREQVDRIADIAMEMIDQVAKQC